MLLERVDGDGGGEELGKQRKRQNDEKQKVDVNLTDRSRKMIEISVKLSERTKEICLQKIYLMEIIMETF